MGRLVRPIAILQRRSAPGAAEHTSFTFLGYAFQARGARKHGRNFTGFLPAISPEALKAKGVELRRMRIHRRTDLSLNDLARWLNPIIAGWINYYGRFYRTALDPLPQARQRLPEALGRATTASPALDVGEVERGFVA